MAAKLLFDQNLSPRLVRDLVAAFPESLHVRDLGLQRADDASIWDWAALDGYVIVTKDDDFRQRSFLYGHPPKVLWLRVGNCRTDTVATLLKGNVATIERFIDETDSALMVLTR